MNYTRFRQRHKTQTVLFQDLFDKPLLAKFNQEHASSDGGAVLLKAAERVYGLVKAFARCLVDHRAPEKIRHTLEVAETEKPKSLGPQRKAAIDKVRFCANALVDAALEAHQLGADAFSQPERNHLMTSFDLVNGQTVINLQREFALLNDKNRERNQ